MWPQGPSSGLYLTYIQKVAIPRRKQSVNKNNEISFRSDLFGILSLRPFLALAAPTAHKLSQKSDCKVLLVKKNETFFYISLQHEKQRKRDCNAYPHL